MSRSLSADFFGSELRCARTAAGMTQEQLAQAITYSPSLVAMVENGKRAPSRDFAKRCDTEFQTDGLFERILDNLIAKDVTPEWFRPWVMIEQEATSLWLFHALAIPGLFQTEAYARAQLQDDDGKTAARMERQEILKRAKPPALVALLDERVLRYAVGDNAVMREQMQRLIEAAERFVVQVIPADCGTYLHLDGSFEMAAVDGREVVFVDTPARGFVIDSYEIVSETKHRWDLIRAEALPRRQSVEFIQKVADQWT